MTQECTDGHRVGIQPHTGRRPYLDYLRAGATLSVICGHVVALAASMLPPYSPSYRILELFRFVFTISNMVFLMISGALLLPVQGERAGTFYRKRFLKVAVPMVICYLLYVCAKEGFLWLRPDHWIPMLRRILAGPPEEAPHFWLVYAILGLYVLTPFLRWIVHNIPDTVFYGVMAVIFLVCGLDTYLPLLGVPSPFTAVTGSFAGVFLLGYFLADRCGRCAEGVFFAAGIVSLAVSFALIFTTDNYYSYLFLNAPTMLFCASAVFLGVKRLCGGMRSTPRPVAFLGRYSYSVLLIHWGVMHVAVKRILRVDVLSGGIWGGCLLMIVLTAAGSMVGAVAFDRLLILPLQRGAACIWSGLCRIGRALFLKKEKPEE